MILCYENILLNHYTYVFIISENIATRFRGLFLISVSNFVFPSLLSLVQLILVFRGPTTGSEVAKGNWFLNCTYIMMVNDYITIVGVVFATVWATGTKWATENGLSSEHLASTHSTTPNNTAFPHSQAREHLTSTAPKLTLPDHQIAFNISNTNPNNNSSTPLHVSFPQDEKGSHSTSSSVTVAELSTGDLSVGLESQV